MKALSWLLWCVCVAATGVALQAGPTPGGKAAIFLAVFALVVGCLIDWTRSRAGGRS
jgi:hypothetical protein